MTEDTTATHELKRTEYYDALQAILDIHSPFRDDCDGATNCRSCSGEDGHSWYPCSTVRAVATMLGVTP